MVLTVPQLGRDALESLVEPDVLMQDDGCTGTFVKAFIYDDMPVVEVDDDLGSVMSLTDPVLCGAVDLPVWGPESPFADDGLEQAWFDAVSYTVPELPAAIAAPAEVLRIAAPSGVPGICAPATVLHVLPPASVPFIAPPCIVEAEAVAEEDTGIRDIIPVAEDIAPMAEDIVEAVEDAVSVVPLVTFSFGPSNPDSGGWKVSFTF